MLLFLTKSCSRPPIVWFDVAIDIIPLVQCIDKGTVLSSSSIVWLPRIPVGENDTFASWFENPLTLSVTVVDAQPEVNFPRIKVLPQHLGIDGSVLLQRVDLNEVSWDFLLFFAELLGFTLCHWGLVEPVATCWELCPRSRTNNPGSWTIIWKSCCKSRKGNDEDKAEDSFLHSSVEFFEEIFFWLLLSWDWVDIVSKLLLSQMCHEEVGTQVGCAHLAASKGYFLICAWPGLIPCQSKGCFLTPLRLYWTGFLFQPFTVQCAPASKGYFLSTWSPHHCKEIPCQPQSTSPSPGAGVSIVLRQLSCPGG